MRRLDEIAAKRASASSRISQECTHEGDLSAKRVGNVKDCHCACRLTYAAELKAFEACIPKKFWNSKRSDVFHNEEIFEEIIEHYCKPDQLRTAGNEGVGIYMQGPNGCGKTMFGCYILMHIIRNTSATVYYTTALQYDHDLKLGFRNSAQGASDGERLEKYMTAHFLVLDEVGKETFKTGDSFSRREFEFILRMREERNKPIIMISNLELEVIRRPVSKGGYGETIGSIIDGSMMPVTMEPGDQRGKKGDELKRKMGW